MNTSMRLMRDMNMLSIRDTSRRLTMDMDRWLMRVMQEKL